jgi:hypothetical protein
LRCHNLAQRWMKLDDFDHLAERLCFIYLFVITMSFPVPPTQAYIYGWRWLAMMETSTDS